jgi:DNA-directed RNA polymerase subunit RPC12/RpoP
MNLKSFNCPNCGASLEPLDDARFMFCQYCGTKIVMDDIEYYRENSKTQREKIRADKEVKKVEAKHKAEVEKEREKRLKSESEDKTALIIILALLIFLALLFFIGP